MKKNKFVFLFSWYLFVIGCSAKPFQPPPAEFLMWKKIDGKPADVRLFMKQCGFNNPYNNNGKMTADEYAKSQKCMTSLGFRDKSGFDMCAGLKGKKLEACK